MKKKRLISFMLSIVLVFSFLLTGCFDFDAAKKAADAYCSLALKFDGQNLDKVGVSESKKDELVGKYNDAIKKQLKNNISLWGGSPSDDQLNAICDAYKEALSKITFETKQISKSGDKAEIEITTTHFNLRRADEQAMMDAMDELQDTSFASDLEESNKLSQVYLNKLPEKLKNAEISTETSKNTFTFKKVNKYWVPEDESNFGFMLIQQVTNDENPNLTIDGERISPKESAEVFWNITAKADASGMEKLGYSKEFGDKLVNYTKKQLLLSMKKDFNDSEASLSDEEVQKMIDAIINGLSKNTAQFEEVSKSDNSATVKITSTVIDLSGILKSAADKTTNDAIASGMTDMQQFMEAYCENFVNEINNAQPINKPGNQRTFNFTKVVDIWVPSNIDKFSDGVSEICVK